jgi:hypothetical protein
LKLHLEAAKNLWQPDRDPADVRASGSAGSGYARFEMLEHVPRGQLRRAAA